jgi:hypothetical protein
VGSEWQTCMICIKKCNTIRANIDGCQARIGCVYYAEAVEDSTASAGMNQLSLSFPLCMRV